MIHMIYPESRWVAEEQIIVWAMDDLANERIENGEFADDQDGSRLETLFASMIRPSLPEAMEILSDRGSCEFSGGTR
jgi:hypothetical protein